MVWDLNFIYWYLPYFPLSPKEKQLKCPLYSQIFQFPSNDVITLKICHHCLYGSQNDWVAMLGICLRKIAILAVLWFIIAAPKLHHRELPTPRYIPSSQGQYLIFLNYQDCSIMAFFSILKGGLATSSLSFNGKHIFTCISSRPVSSFSFSLSHSYTLYSMDPDFNSLLLQIVLLSLGWNHFSRRSWFINTFGSKLIPIVYV